jgi:HEAT repeat protein
VSDKLNELDELLEDLADEAEAIPSSRLCVLSDLWGERIARFRAAWSTFSFSRRRWLLRALVDLAEANFEVTFDAVFRFCLDDEDELVRSLAVDGLWECQDVSLTGRLLSMLRSDPSPTVRAAAARGLGRFVLAGELEKLEDTIHSRIITELLTSFHVLDESVDVRRRVVESVAYASDPHVREVIEAAYYDDDEGMRVSAVTGMGRSCDRHWEPAVLQELESLSPAMLYEAALASGELGLQSAVPALAELTRHPDRQLSDAAVWALGQISGDRSKDALEAAYAYADEEMTSAIDDALGEHALSDDSIGFPLYDLRREVDGDALGERLTLFPEDEEESPRSPGFDDWDDEKL